MRPENVKPCHILPYNMFNSSGYTQPSVNFMRLQRGLEEHDSGSRLSSINHRPPVAGLKLHPLNLSE